MVIIYSILILAVSIASYLNMPKFGSLPEGEYAEKIKKSPNYKNKKFQNLSNTPQLTGGNFLTIMWDYLTTHYPNTKPLKPIPTIKTNLFKLARDEDALIWFGHSSYFIQTNHKTFLIDPVFSKTASPVPFNVVAFEGTNIYSVDDIPYIDYLIISHDHWDHLDYPTITQLKPKVGKIICGLGVGAHFLRWGFSHEQIVEMDWEDTLKEKGTEIYGLPARHFSGRGLISNQSLWMSFLIKIDNFTFYIGGDSGYDNHYKNIGNKFKNIDLAILDSGQYDQKWRYIHENPNEVISATKDLNAKALLPVHHSKFTISNHPWNEPLIRLKEASTNKDFRLLTPMIGEKINLKDTSQTFQEWWNF